MSIDQAALALFRYFVNWLSSFSADDRLEVTERLIKKLQEYQDNIE